MELAVKFISCTIVGGLFILVSCLLFIIQGCKSRILDFFVTLGATAMIVGGLVVLALTLIVSLGLI